MIRVPLGTKQVKAYHNSLIYETEKILDLAARSLTYTNQHGGELQPLLVDNPELVHRLREH